MIQFQSLDDCPSLSQIESLWFSRPGILSNKTFINQVLEESSSPSTGDLPTVSSRERYPLLTWRRDQIREVQQVKSKILHTFSTTRPPLLTTSTNNVLCNSNLPLTVLGLRSYNIITDEFNWRTILLNKEGLYKLII